MNKYVYVLGTRYEIIRVNAAELGANCGGTCDCDTKEIRVAMMDTVDGWENESEKKISEREKYLLRHEIVHAFLNESGLRFNSVCYCEGWSTNEEMVDWIACQGEKIHSVWKEAGAV